MAEEEKIEQHAKKALRTLTNKKKKWKEKIRDFLWEILIIIVGVSITLWFHNWNDRRQDRELEKNFLIGVRSDLHDITLTLDSGFVQFQPTLDYYDTLWAQMNTHRISAAYLNNHSYNLINTCYFTYDNSRFESFKSSGYLKLIENEKLLEDISKLYGVDLPQQEDDDNLTFDFRRNNFITYIGSKAVIDSSGNTIITDLLNDKGFRYQIFIQRIALQDLKRHKKGLLDAVKKVIPEIDKELKERFGYEVANKNE